jgi:hypothetical protein
VLALRELDEPVEVAREMHSVDIVDKDAGAELLLILTNLLKLFLETLT